MKKYRIKIVETNNGKVTFTPMFNDEYIIHQINHVFGNKMSSVETHTNFSCECETEEEALHMINKFKEQQANEEGHKIKTTTFKDIL
jgi:hypothetical protein